MLYNMSPAVNNGIACVTLANISVRDAECRDLELIRDSTIMENNTQQYKSMVRVYFIHS